MNTTLKTIALVAAAAFPTAFSAESFGVTLPSILSTGNLFGAFVVALVLLTMSTDYRKTKPLHAALCTSTAAGLKASLRLAA